MSMSHTRAIIEKTIPKVGDGLYDDAREKMFTVVEDTTPGFHDTLVAACDAPRYEKLGCTSYHRNCEDNMREGLVAIGMSFFHFRLLSVLSFFLDLFL